VHAHGDAIAGFAAMLAGIADSARKASDTLALRHFVHVDTTSRVTLSA